MSLILLLLLGTASGLRLNPSHGLQRRAHTVRSPSPACCDYDDSPSDSSDDDVGIECDADGNCDVPSSFGDVDENRMRLKTDILRLSAACNRGEAASDADRETARTLVSSLEMLNPTPLPTAGGGCLGTWELLFSDTQLFRSSPFFMAGRAVCEDGRQAGQYDWFCDMHRAALAISTIGKVRQVVSDSMLISEFETQAGAVPFVSDFVPLAYSGGLPLTINGAIVSTATIESNLGGAYRLLMDTVEIKGSNIPGLRQALDAGLKLQSRQLGSALESVVPTYANPQPLFQVTFLDAGLRISRDQDGKVFVYAKQSDSTEPTDYSRVSSDLGVSSLLQGVASTLFG